jgi:hypothetical protein
VDSTEQVSYYLVTETESALNVFDLYSQSVIHTEVEEGWLDLWRIKELYRFIMRKACRKRPLWRLKQRQEDNILFNLISKFIPSFHIYLFK